LFFLKAGLTLKHPPTLTFYKDNQSKENPTSGLKIFLFIEQGQDKGVKKGK